MRDDSFYFYDGVGNVSYSDILPPRTVSDAVKESKSFKIDLLDRLEMIGLRQLIENAKYQDYFKMVSGELVYADLVDEEETELFSDINTVREEIGLCTNLRHYDFIGDAVNTVLGEWLLQKDKFRFDTVDEVSSNEYTREQTDKLNQFAQLKFQIELNRKFAERGIDPDKQFENLEQQQQYIAQLEEQAKLLIPENIRNEMKDWKTSAANWAEKTYKRDHQRFKMDLIESEEALNKLLTGIAPRHYVVGFDYYEPESWSPINTFYSKDPHLKFIQDGEFAGRVHFMPIHEIIEKFGHKLSAKRIEQISETFTGKYKPTSTASGGTRTIDEILDKNFVEPEVHPFKGADQYALQLQFQDAFGAPMGTTTNEEGQEVDRWLPGFDNNYNATQRYAYLLKTNKGIRSDLIQVTEAYVKCYKKIGILTYRTETGYLDTMEVDENLLSEFIKENEIKRVNTVSLEEAYKDPKENTIVYTYFPVIYKGLKIKTSTNFSGEDIYFLEPLEFQIKDNSNYYKLKLPVFGHIDNGIAEPMRPFQRDYNWVMNQNKNLMEKELGMFFMLDVNFLPSEFMDLSGDSKDILTNMYNTIKEIGILPVDASKGNLGEKGGVQFNSFMSQNVTYTPQIQRNVELGRLYKQEAFSRIGITPQREGAPTSYETATGVRISQNAGYSKTMNVFQSLLYDKQCKIEGHLAIAQHCQLKNKDANYIFRAGDDELTFLESIKDDEDFALRMFGVYPVMDASKRREFEDLKATILGRNTMTADEYSLAELLYSDDYLELRKAADNLRKYKEAQNQQQQRHEENLINQQLQQRDQQHKEVMELEYAKLQNKLDVERIESLGRLGANDNVQDPIGDVNKATDRALKQEIHQGKQGIELQRLQQDLENNLMNFNVRMQDLKLKEAKLQQQERNRKTTEFTSIINKN